jgi:hypothetical protein
MDSDRLYALAYLVGYAQGSFAGILAALDAGDSYGATRIATDALARLRERKTND